MGSYIHTPDSITWQDVIRCDYTFSSSQYQTLVIANKNLKCVSDYLSRDLRRDDIGTEVGSLSYIDKSPCGFIRTKALKEYSFLPDFNQGNLLPILPSEFIQMNLKRGDILISKDGNIGEIAILDKDYPNYMLSGAICRLPVEDKWRYYLLAFIKHDVFRSQLDYIVPKGATIRHAKTLFLNCKIPMPNHNTKKVIQFVSFLTRAIINKEECIRQRHNKILSLIEKELLTNQQGCAFNYYFPTFNEVNKLGRIDTNMYRRYFKQEIFSVLNYKGGVKNIEELGFKLSRGQNLQVSNIGKSIYSKNWHPGFYTLVLPMFLSKYGTVDKVSYLGNRNSLKTLKKGDLIFGAEGFEKGRSIVVVEDTEKTITNIHGITLQQDEHDLSKAIFAKCFMDYLRDKRLVDLFAVGGNGGSLAQKYWPYIPFPCFPKKKQEEIVSLYHKPLKYDTSSFTLDNFIEKDNDYNSKVGIYELDKTVKYLKEKLNKTIDNIINDKEVVIDF